MRNQPTTFQPGHRLIGVAATIAVHIGLLLFWLLTRQAGGNADGTPAEAIEWVNVRAERPVAAAKPPVARPEPVVRKKPPTTAAPVAPAAPAPERQEAARDNARDDTQPGEPEVQAPPARSAYDIMRQAGRDIGQIDKEINKELPSQRIRKPRDTAQTRLEKGIELANELAPPKWYEKPKITELIDPGGYGRRRYRIITAQGTFCMTYESAQSPDGRDPATRSTAPKMTNCPPHEEPAKAQAW